MLKSIVLLVLLTAGCASAANIYSSGVDETAVIQKPLGEVVQCMTLKMGSAPITDPDGKTAFVVKDAYDHPLGLISLSPAAAGTLVEVRRRDSLASTGMWKSCR